MRCQRNYKPVVTASMQRFTHWEIKLFPMCFGRTRRGGESNVRRQLARPPDGESVNDGIAPHHPLCPPCPVTGVLLAEIRLIPELRSSTVLQQVIGLEAADIDIIQA